MSEDPKEEFLIQLGHLIFWAIVFGIVLSAIVIFL